MSSTPGVYIQEVSTLPPSIAEVSTAIPAFIGYTTKNSATNGGVDIAQVSTLLEYQERFGKSNETTFTFKGDGTLSAVPILEPKNMLWYAMDLYFKNGGGRCYIFSIGAENDSLNKDKFISGLTELKKIDEPTLIVMPQACCLEGSYYKEVCEAALQQCQDLGDRFAILDVKDDDSTGASFRTTGNGKQLAYGAAYYPHLNTTITHIFNENTVSIPTSAPAPPAPPAAALPAAAPPASAATPAISSSQNLSGMKKTALYGQILKTLSAQRVTLPPSAAIAGIYCRVDRERGVWKAPANEALMAVIGPTVQISQAEQEKLNIDADGGKSINAIRSFAGRGVLVWGARTLAGNDNEWKYISVRRLFIMIEESAKKATAFAVFESNDATTWLKVKGMLDSYLYGLWEKGALQGSKPEAAYYVNVGLGKTMTQQHILDGQMIVEIGIAAVRPAEFITLRFSHKLAEA